MLGVACYGFLILDFTKQNFNRIYSVTGYSFVIGLVVGKKNGRVVTEVLDSLNEGLSKLEETHKRRLAHGYQLIEDHS